MIIQNSKTDKKTYVGAYLEENIIVRSCCTVYYDNWNENIIIKHGLEVETIIPYDRYRISEKAAAFCGVLQFQVLRELEK